MDGNRILIARSEPGFWMPGWETALVLGLIGVAVFVSWFAATALLVFLLAQRARPLGFTMSYLMVAAGAVFIRYEAGQLTRELSLLSALILFMLISYLWSNRGRLFVLPRTTMLVPLLVFVALTAINYVRGVLTGSSLRYANLELLPVLAFASALLVANGFDPARDLRLSTAALLAAGYGSASLGFQFFATYHTRTGGVFFMPVPGMVAMLAVNLALRARRTIAAVTWTVLSIPLFLHQFLSFTRGYWLGCIAGILVSFAVYVVRRDGVRPRLRRVGLVCGTLAIAGLAAGITLTLATGQADLLALAGNRLGSITETRFTNESASNLARLAEYGVVISHIGAAPWFGHGVGYALNFRAPIGFEMAEQWYTHQIYLFVLLKQGLVGLIAFVWMLGSATLFCLRASRRNDDPWESGWLASAGACTVLLAVLDMTNFHLTNVNSTFPLALLWGGAMAIACEGSIRFRWTRPSEPPQSAQGAS